jgi:hypothetical protein
VIQSIEIRQTRMSRVIDIIVIAAAGSSRPRPCFGLVLQTLQVAPR